MAAASDEEQEKGEKEMRSSEQAASVGGEGEGEVCRSKMVVVHDNLSENPETGQSELIGEEVVGSRVGMSESEEGDSTGGGGGDEIPAAEAVSAQPSSAPLIQLQQVSEVLQVSGCCDICDQR